MVELNFFISEKDYDFLMDLKEEQKKDDLSANDFARQLLEDAILRAKIQRREKNNGRR